MPQSILKATLTLTTVCILAATQASGEIDRAAARDDMRNIFASIRTLLPLSVDDAAFRSEANQAVIRAALKKLESRAEHVSGHIAGDDRRIRFLATSLAQETKDAKRLFEKGQFENAQFLVRRFTDFCVACHTRVPSPADSPLAQGFVSVGAMAKLPPSQRASIQVATRRFDDALATYEALFALPSARPAELLSPLSEYLRVSIRVKNDLDRPRATLQKFVKRPDLWSILRADVEDWLKAIDRNAAPASDKPTVERARALLEDARTTLRFPMDQRAGLIQQYLASSELHRFLELHDGESGPDVAEAYYLLGLIESQTSFNFLVPESDFYLETAIRLAPKGRIGSKAFELFEERAVLGWTGSRGTHMPDDVRENLEALRRLVGASPAGKKKAN